MTNQNYWQQKINFYMNSIIECEEAGQNVPSSYRNGLKLAEASLKCWKAAAV